MKIKRYDRTGCDDLSGIFVKHSDYAALEAKCAALAAGLEYKQKDLEECAMDKVELSGSLTFTTLHYEERETEMNNALCELLPGIQYMDPPDGGSVTPLEQVRRMVADYRQRIAELEAREIVLPPRAPENLAACLDGYDKWVIATTFRDTWNACLADVVRVNTAVISTDSAVEELVAAGIITKVGE